MEYKETFHVEFKDEIIEVNLYSLDLGVGELGTGDMRKSIYDTDENNIVDKAESVDDGAGNASSASDIKDTITKKHEHSNKTVLDLIQEALTTALKSIYDDAVFKAHEHSNKVTLDLIEEAFTTALKTAYDSCVVNEHTHSNKSILDNIQEAFTSALKIAYDDAVSKVHTHSNKAIIDLIEEALTSALKTAYDDAVTKAHDSKLLGTKEIDESNIGDKRIIQYFTSSGKLQYIDFSLSVYTNIVFVDTSGSDITGDGSMEKPYALPSKGYTEAKTKYGTPSATNPVVVKINPGIYDDTFDADTDYIYIVGATGNPKDVVIVNTSTADHTIDMTSNGDISYITIRTVQNDKSAIEQSSGASSSRLFNCILDVANGNVSSHGIKRLYGECESCRFIGAILSYGLIQDLYGEIRYCRFESATAQWLVRNNNYGSLSFKCIFIGTMVSQRIYNGAIIDSAYIDVSAQLATYAGGDWYNSVIKCGASSGLTYDFYARDTHFETSSGLFASAGATTIKFLNCSFNVGGIILTHTSPKTVSFDGSVVYAGTIGANITLTGSYELPGGAKVEAPITQAITAVGDTINADAGLKILNPDGDYVMTSTPTIPDGLPGQILTLTVAEGEANTVTVQDEGSLGGSNLELKAVNRAIGAGNILRLRFINTKWYEESYV